MFAGWRPSEPGAEWVVRDACQLERDDMFVEQAQRTLQAIEGAGPVTCTLDEARQTLARQPGRPRSGRQPQMVHRGSGARLTVMRVNWGAKPQAWFVTTTVGELGTSGPAVQNPRPSPSSAAVPTVPSLISNIVGNCRAHCLFGAGADIDDHSPQLRRPSARGPPGSPSAGTNTPDRSGPARTGTGRTSVPPRRQTTLRCGPLHAFRATPV